MVLVAPAGQGLDRARRRIDCEFGAVPVCGRAEPRAVPRGDRIATAEPRSGPSPARLRSAMPDFYIMVGRSKDGLVAAANRRLYEDTGDACGGLAAAARRRMASGDHGRRPSGRTPRRDGDETRTWRSQRADCPAPSARRTGRADDAAQRHRRVARAPARRDRRAQSETHPIPENGGDGSAHRRRGARFQQSADRHPRQCGTPRREAGGAQGTAQASPRASRPPPNAART